MAKKAAKKTTKQASRRLKGASPVTGVVPPPEHRFKPGQSGNPKGLPKGTVKITDRLRKVFEQDEGRVADALVSVITKAALRGDHKFITTIIDRLDGPLRQESLVNIGSSVKLIHAEDEALLDPKEKG
jgi:hypothetical protein